MQLFTIKVVDTRKEAIDILVLRLEKPPGFDFQPGQYVMMYLPVDGKDESRQFSIASSPTKPYLEFATKDTGSAFKNTWKRLKPGDGIRISKPLGKFVLDVNAPHIILISGGIGITPFRSMLEYAVDKKLSNNIILLYSNKVPEDIPFERELNELPKQNGAIKIEMTVTRPEESTIKTNYRTGRIDGALIKEHSRGGDAYYICGPPGLVVALEKTLEELGVPATRIRMELFTGYK